MDLLRKEPELAALALLMDRTFDDLRAAGERPRSADRPALAARADLWDNIGVFGAACALTRGSRRRAARARWRTIGRWTSGATRQWVEEHLASLDGGPRLNPRDLLGAVVTEPVVSVDHFGTPRHWGQRLTPDVRKRVLADYHPSARRVASWVEVQGESEAGRPYLAAGAVLDGVPRKFSVAGYGADGQPPSDARLILAGRDVEEWDVSWLCEGRGAHHMNWDLSASASAAGWTVERASAQLGGRATALELQIDDALWGESGWWRSGDFPTGEARRPGQWVEARMRNNGSGGVARIAQVLRALMIRARSVRYPMRFSPQMLRAVGAAGSGAALALTETLVASGLRTRGEASSAVLSALAARSQDDAVQRLASAARYVDASDPWPELGEHVPGTEAPQTTYPMGTGLVFGAVGVEGARLRRLATVHHGSPGADNDASPQQVHLCIDSVGDSGQAAAGHLLLTGPTTFVGTSLRPSTLDLIGPVRGQRDADGVLVEVPLVDGIRAFRARDAEWWVS